MQHNQNNRLKSQYVIMDRRRRVADLYAQAFTEVEIAEQLNVERCTIIRDLKYLKDAAQNFVFDLAKSNLAFFYRDCMSGIEAVKRRAWDIANRPDVTDKIRLAALRLAKDCDKDRFELLQNGPSILNVKALNDRVVQIEERSNGSSKPSQ